jgi:predicted RNA-binding Zn-ribbon protein involved in translation (DUF1610 family)
MEKSCFFCGTSIDVKERPGRKDVCPKCGRDIHACLQCRFYDVTAYHRCREPQAEWVSDKENANFCDYFEFGREKKVQKAAESARDKLEALFKKKG